MKVLYAILMILIALHTSCGKSTTESLDENPETFIEIKSLIPEAGTILTVQDTIKAELQYAIANDISSDFGFSLSIKFSSKTMGETFSVGPEASINISERSGTISIEYPLGLIWTNQNLKHPVSCYFYLHQMTSETASKVIARTAEITYSE